ncbi:hypothetical protein MRX96_017433 [Rhipicephalus microplus]
MELRSPVPNITDVDGNVVRCEYDGVVSLCRKCRLPGYERKTGTTPWCTRASSVGIPPAMRLASAVVGFTLHTSASRGCTRRQPCGPVRRSNLQPCRSETTSPEYKRHAATAAVDDDSSSTTVEDSEMDARSQASCDVCKSVACDCSDFSDTSYPFIPVPPTAGEPVA